MKQMVGKELLANLAQVKEGTMYDLASGWWRHMPCNPVHPTVDVVTYRSQLGEMNQQDMAFVRKEVNYDNYGFNTEMLIACMHVGSHIDAMCHIFSGKDPEFHGGYKTREYTGDFGFLAGDATEIPLLVRRGVLLDVPTALGMDTLTPSFAITSEHLQKTCEVQGTKINEGDVVLVRTGQMKYWPDEEAMMKVDNAGVSLDGAKWIRQFSPVATGTDTAAYEVGPSGIEGAPQPVHVYLIKEEGINIMEWINLEELAQDKVYEFLFVALPLNITGATGSFIRPVAII